MPPKQYAGSRTRARPHTVSKNRADPPDTQSICNSTRKLRRVWRRPVRANPQEWTNDPDDVIGALYYPAYAQAYFAGLRDTDTIIQADGLARVLAHVVDTHRESMLEGADDENGWRDSLIQILLIFEDLASNIKMRFSNDTLVNICRTICGVADGRYEDHVCSTLTVREIRQRFAPSSIVLSYIHHALQTTG